MTIRGTITTLRVGSEYADGEPRFQIKIHDATMGYKYVELPCKALDFAPEWGGDVEISFKRANPLLEVSS